MSKNLILYYSRKGENYVNGGVQYLTKGNTEICAEYIQKAVGGDLFEIETVKDYAADYYQCVEEAVAEFKSNARPELKAYPNGIERYDNVFVCGPCWCGTFPCAVFSLLEKLDFDGKNVFVLMTHEGSGLGNSERDLKRLCKGAKFGSGLAIRGVETSKSEEVISSWGKKCILERT